MKSKIIAILLFMTALFYMHATGRQQAGSSSQLALKNLTIGYVQAGPAPYYQASADAAGAAIAKLGAKSVILNSQDSPQKEMSNVEDLVARSVNAILLFTTNSDTAQRAAQLCNDAKIPLIVIGSEASKGKGAVTSTIKADFLLFGQTVGKYVAKNLPNAKVGIVEGALGAGICEPISEGFITEATKGTSVTIVAQQATDFSRAVAMSVAENILTAHPEIDTIFVHNEDMAAGVIQAIKDAGRGGTIKVLSTNGSNEGIEMIKAGELLATANESPYQEGALAVKTALDAIYGKQVPQNITTPTVLITKDNLSEVIPWSLEAINMVDWSGYIK